MGKVLLYFERKSTLFYCSKHFTVGNLAQLPQVSVGKTAETETEESPHVEYHACDFSERPFKAVVYCVNCDKKFCNEHIKVSIIYSLAYEIGMKCKALNIVTCAYPQKIQRQANLILSSNSTIQFKRADVRFS